MIRIVLLIPTLDRSGAEKQFSLLATRLPRDEFDVHAVALTRGGPYEETLREHEIPLTVLNKRLRFDPFALRRLKRVLKDLNPDVVHSWLFAGNAYARLAAGRRGLPRVIVSERCVDSWKSGWQLWLDRLWIKRTDRMIANSESVAAFYREQGVPADKVVVIPNGVEIPEEAAADRDAALAEFDIPAGAKVVGFAGRLAKQKRILDLVWAMQLLRQINDDGAHFLIVGDGPLRTEAVAMAKHMGCDHLCRFVGHREDATRLIGLMDVFWLASEFEGMSNSVMEAMAAGVPVVATDIPANRELVVGGETGYVVKIGDSVGFAQFADRILADKDLARRLGEAARERVRSKFSVDTMVEGHAALYRDVV